jgi:hypothetical protein
VTSEGHLEPENDFCQATVIAVMIFSPSRHFAPELQPSARENRRRGLDSRLHLSIFI